MEIVRDVEEKPVAEAPKIAYDPNKRYKWKPEDVFVLTGNDFGLILNALRGIVNLPLGYQTLSLAEKASQAIENSLKAAVEAGVVQESKSEDNKKG